ncbi:hypothetical protein [Desertibaculum subflavum]|uniref:hypothetical protein n=1 Tax=Desertibaculum subflavum TaxID=2268458 RepID=UPI000E66EF0E
MLSLELFVEAVRTFLLIFTLLVGRAEEAKPMYEFEGYQSRFFELKRVEIDDRTGTTIGSFVVPADWRSGLTQGDNIWLADPDENYILQRSGGFRPIGADEAATLRGLLGELRREASIGAGLPRPRSYRHEDHTIFESAQDTTYDGRQVRIRNLFRIWPEDGKLYLVGYHLITRPEIWDRPETADIVDLLRAQILRGRFWAAASVLDKLPPTPAAYRFDFRDLHHVQPHGFMSIGVPRHWRAHESGGAQGYYDPDQRSGALWISYHVVIRDHGSGLTPSREVDRYWRQSKDPEIERLQWMVKDTTADRSMIVLIDLMLDEGQADDPEFQELILILDEQVRRMKIGLPPPEAEATREIGRPSAKRGRA